MIRVLKYFIIALLRGITMCLITQENDGGFVESTCTHTRLIGCCRVSRSVLVTMVPWPSRSEGDDASFTILTEFI